MYTNVSAAQVEFVSKTFHSSVHTVSSLLNRQDITCGQLFTICARKRTVHIVKIAIIIDPVLGGWWFVIVVDGASDELELDFTGGATMRFVFISTGAAPVKSSR